MSLTAAVDVSGLTWRAGAVVVSLLQPLVWACLGVLFVLASIHLISMLATQWGDHRASGKSLAFSAGLHVAVLVGMIALLPEYRPRWFSADAAEEEPPIQIRAIVQQEEIEATTNATGNTPIWDRLQESPEVRQTRLTSEPQPVDEPQVAERTERVEQSPFELPMQQELPAKPQEVPRELAMAEYGPIQPADVPLPEEQTSAEARPDSAPTAMSRDRVRPVDNVSQGTARDVPEVQAVVRGAVDRKRDTFKPDAMLRSLPAARSERATLASAESTMITRRDGPTPADLPVDQVGVDDPRTSSTNSAASRARPRMERSRTIARNAQPFDAESLTLPNRTRTRPQSMKPELASPGEAFEGFDIERPKLRETPEFARASVDALKLDDSSRLPAEYQLRAADGRLDAARKFGGTESSERAVELSLKYLASIQEPAGYWAAEKYGAGQGAEAADDRARPNVGRDADAGVTALCILAYLGAGSTHESGKYRDNVNRGLRWLIASQREDGYLGGSDVNQITGAYCHAMATFAIAEASAMREADSPALRDLESGEFDNSWLLEPLRKAISYTFSAQLSDGGWRYIPRQRGGGDMSIFGWHLMGLKSAELAGIEIPDRVRAGMVYFLTNRALGDKGGLAGYRVGEDESASMTAESLFCKQMLGLRRTNDASQEAVDYLMARLPKLTQQDFYYWYYGTLALYQYGGEPWQSWNERLRELLVAEQESNGSWAPRGPWGPYGGRVYSTALATLTLEVYYRYLPLYKAGGRYRETR